LEYQNYFRELKEALMKYFKMSAFNLRLSTIGMVLLAFALTAYQPLATAFGYDPSVDSEIQLIEKPGDAPYTSLFITMLTKDGDTTLTVIEDDKKTKTSMPYEAYADLWKYLLEKKVEHLESPSEDEGSSPQLPGQSMFTVKVRDGSETHTWTAYGVDFLGASNYRDIVRQIMSVAERFMPCSPDSGKPCPETQNH
jgi:hypothetical protein